MKLHEFSNLAMRRLYSFIAGAKLGIPLSMLVYRLPASAVVDCILNDPRIGNIRASLTPEAYSEEEKLKVLEMLADWWAISMQRTGFRDSWSNLITNFNNASQIIGIDRGAVIFIESILYSRQHGIPFRDSYAPAEHWELA